MTIRVISTPPPHAPESAILRRIRVRTEDSAFLYCLFESYEGIVGYSTLDSQPGEAYRDLELTVPQGFCDEVSELLIQLGDWVYELDTEK